MKETIKQLALECGFARVGIARAEELNEEGERLRNWLERGFHGQMHYMAKTADVRVNPNHAGMLPSAKSLVVVAAPYVAPASENARVGQARIARYAQGRDYHRVLRRKIRPLRDWLHAQGYAARVSIDSMPVFERAWAQRAGVGFVGKNACLIVPGLGSHVFLAALVTSAELEPDAPMLSRCGTCTLCLEGCPTQAFVGPMELDARKCISYWTIEHRGVVPEAMRAPMGDWLFGCDVCQDVCPFNHTTLKRAEVDPAFHAHERLQKTELESFLRLDETTFKEQWAGSALSRARWDGMARNVATVLGTQRSRRHLPILQEVAAQHPSPVVREAATWAVERIVKDGSP